jgi:hypothetical protein
VKSILAANSQPESLIPVAIFPRSHWHRTGGKFSSGINKSSSTGGKFTAFVVDTGGKFAYSVFDTGGTP